MRKVRIGNDINVRWEVKTDGNAVSLEGKALKLYVRSAYKKEEITTFTVEGCVVSFTYPASMQRMTGARAVILEDATEGAPRRTVCADQAFILVAHSCEESDDDVEFEDFMVSLQSNVLIGKPGLSAYEVWLSEGNTGTLEDWYAFLRKPATDIAADVAEAEAERKAAETARQEAEEGRITSEQERTTAETARAKAEQARQGDENLRKTAEENRVSAETGRSDAEQRRDANETSREKAEQMRKSDEADRIRDEKERKEAETSRKAAEKLRDTAENDRNDAEQERRQHEDARADAEGKRDTAETLRKQAETGRNNAEQERTTAEQTRKDSEASRVDAEQERTASEQTRHENETARVTAETERGKNETERITAETERKSAEQERTAAERERTTSEQARQENETTRVSAETERVLAELSRQRAEAKREQAAKDNKAANDAAVAAAFAAAAAADTATGKANTATEKANAAADKVKTAVAEAENVNVTLNDSIISVTNRKGETKTAFLMTYTDEEVSIHITSLVSGIKVGGIKINVYLNNGKTPQTYTTNNDGSVSFVVNRGNYYQIVFPEYGNAQPISPIGYTAVLSARSIDVQYKPYEEGMTEKVVVTVKKYTDNVGTIWEGIPVTISYDGKDTVLSTDSNGQVQTFIPLGKEYSINIEDTNGYYVNFYRNTRTYRASFLERDVTYNLYQYRTGIFVLDANKGEYTIDEWVAAGKIQDEAVAIKISDINLCINKGTFAIRTSDIKNVNSVPDLSYCRINTLFKSIQSDGANVNNPNYYNGAKESFLVLQEAHELNISVPAFEFANAETLTIDGEKLRGMIGSVGQEFALINNKVLFQDVVTKLYNEGIASKFWNTISTRAIWASGQQGASYAYGFYNEQLRVNTKNNIGRAVLVFFSC